MGQVGCLVVLKGQNARTVLLRLNNPFPHQYERNKEELFTPIATLAAQARVFNKLLLH